MLSKAKMAHRAACLLLVLCMALGLIPLNVLYADVTRADDDVSAVEVPVLAPPAQAPGRPLELHMAYIFGDDLGNFHPGVAITRAEVAAILARVRIEGFSQSGLPSNMIVFDTFSDVSENAWYYRYIAWAYATGLVLGDPTNNEEQRNFRPNDPITRQEFAAMVARTIQLRYDEPGSTQFDDWDIVSDWAKSYVYNVFRVYWIVGDDLGNFRPHANITRAEVATVINRILGRVDSWGVFTRANLQNPEHIRVFPDVSEAGWYYPSVVGATNDHRLQRDSAGEIDYMEILP